MNALRMIAHLARPERHTMWDEDVTQAMAKDTLARWTALEDNPRVIFRFDQHDETAYEALKAVIGCRAAGRSVATLTA